MMLVRQMKSTPPAPGTKCMLSMSIGKWYTLNSSLVKPARKSSSGISPRAFPFPVLSCFSQGSHSNKLPDVSPTFEVSPMVINGPDY